MGRLIKLKVLWQKKIVIKSDFGTLPQHIRKYVTPYPTSLIIFAAITLIFPLHFHQGAPAQLAEMVKNGDVDFAIATESMHLYEDLITLPCYRWTHAVY